MDKTGVIVLVFGVVKVSTTREVNKKLQMIDRCFRSVSCVKLYKRFGMSPQNHDVKRENCHVKTS